MLQDGHYCNRWAPRTLPKGQKPQRVTSDTKCITLFCSLKKNCTSWACMHMCVGTWPEFYPRDLHSGRRELRTKVSSDLHIHAVMHATCVHIHTEIIFKEKCKIISCPVAPEFWMTCHFRISSGTVLAGNLLWRWTGYFLAKDRLSKRYIVKYWALSSVKW